MLRHIDRGHKKQNIDKYRNGGAGRFRLWLIGMLGILLSLAWAQPVHAADGTLSIAVTASEVKAGEEVKVVLAATGPGGEQAVADMEFTYNSEIFSFVSCNAQGYGGGDGGKVTFRGGSVAVILKAKAAGSCKLKVTGTKGAIRESGQELANMVAAGATINGVAAESEPEPTKSGDNSLAQLSLSEGELSPAFAYGTTSYTATVPNGTTSVEVHAVPSNGKAQVVSTEGNTDLKVGENTIRITVKAENGALAVYTIKVTREDQTAQTQPLEPQAPGDQEPGSQEPNAQTPGDQQTGIQEPQTPGEDQAAEIESYERRLESLGQQYDQLEEKYRAEKSFHRKVMAVLIFVIVLLVIVCVNIAIFMRRERPKKNKKSKKNKKNRDEEWLDGDEEDDMESAIFSSNAIPAPRKEESEAKSVDFINLDDL